MDRKHIFLPEYLTKQITADAKKHGVSFGEMVRRVLSSHYDPPRNKGA